MNPIVSSLKHVLQLVGCEPGLVTVASWEADFAELWRLPDDLVRRIHDEAVPQVIVWDRAPAGPLQGLRLSDYTSPIDWAVALGCSMRGLVDSAARDDSTPRGRVVILKCNDEEMPARARVLASLQATEQAPFPWLRLLDQRDWWRLGPLLRAVSATDSAAARASAERDADGVIEEMWRAALTRSANPGDRHAIANLIGPRLLLGRFEPAVQDPRLAALEKLLTSLNIIRPPDAATRGSDFPWVSKAEWEPYISKFVLVDDLHDRGWSAFVEEALDARGYVLTSRTGELPDGESVVEHLEKAVEGEEPLPGFGGETWDRTILLLDLRLFAGRPVSEEMQLFRRLLELARASEKFERQDLDAVEQCISGCERETPNYYVALTLLPRLLAWADPFLPIVLFSSTSQRAVVTRLQRHPNILVDFEKPSLPSADPETVLANARLQFQRVVRRAIAIARARAFCRQCLCEAAPAASPVQSGAYLEVFIDESATPECGSAKSERSQRLLVVGGVGIVYESLEGPARLDAALHKAKLCWGFADGCGPLKPSDAVPPFTYKYRRSNVDVRDLSRAADIMTEVGGHPFAFAFYAPEPDTETELDGLHRSMVRDLLEAVLFSVRPALGCPSAPWAADVATRAVPLSLVDAQGEKISQKEATRRFGVQFFPDGRFCSLAGTQVYGFVRDLMYSRSAQARPREPDRARGVRLVSLERVWTLRKAYAAEMAAKKNGEAKKKYEALFGPQPRPQQVHYLADMVTRHVRRVLLGGAELGDPLTAWFRAGFLDPHERARGWLEASRAGDVGRPAAALGRYWQCRQDSVGVFGDEFSLGRWVAVEARQWARTLLDAPSGFAELVRQFEGESSGQADDAWRS